MSKPDGGPAYPTPFIEIDGTALTALFQGGMTLRDYFAAKAMQGFIASSPPDSNPFSEKFLAKMAADFYTMADAMIAERDKA